MKIVMLTIGRTRTPYLAEGIDVYMRRAGHYLPVEICELPDVKTTRALTEERQKQLEGEKILEFVQTGDALVLMDERGREYTSREFADVLSRRMASGLKRLVLTIGGPYGFSSEVYARADGKISLSKMTLPHEMARLMLAEQIYRAMTILRGEPYHHD